MSILGGIIAAELEKEFAEAMSCISEAFAKLGELAEDLCLMIYPAGYEPFRYARQLCRRQDIREMFRGISCRNRSRQYTMQYVPCAHAACGVMIPKKGRLVRRKR